MSSQSNILIAPYHTTTRLSGLGWFLFGLGVYSLLAAIIGTVSNFQSVGRPHPGFLYTWLGAKNCVAVDWATPPSWELIDTKQLHVGDCIQLDHETVNQSIGDRFQQALRSDQPAAPLMLHVERDSQQFVLPITIERLQLHHIIESQSSYIIIRIAFIMLGFTVLFAGPQLRSNQAFAGLMFCLTLLFTGTIVLEQPYGHIYTAATLIVGYSFLGVLLFDLGTHFPTPLQHRWIIIIRRLLWVIAFGSLILHELGMAFLRSDAAWPAQANNLANTINAINMLIGLTMFLGHVGWLIRSRHQHLATLARITLFAWSIGVIPLALVISGFLITSRWIFPGTTLVSFITLPLIAVVGTTFAMLRYQAFAYRGRVMIGLTAAFSSAAITQLVVFVLLLVGKSSDGIDFAIIWVATLMTTLLWYIDNPLRRVFRNYFLRDQSHYRIAHRFAQQLQPLTSLEAIANTGCQAFCKQLDLRWAALRLNDFADEQWYTTPVTTIRQARQPFETPPAFMIPLQSGAMQIGELFLGPRTSAEPLDEQDRELIDLLSSYLTIALQIQAQFRRLEAVPGLIIAAEERERATLGRDLHDTVLQFLGTIPLGMAKIRRQIQQQTPPEQINEQLTLYEQQAMLISRETRAIVQHLSLQQLAHEGLLASLHHSLRQLCSANQVEFHWHVDTHLSLHYDSSIATTIYRIIYQAASNALQHANPQQLTCQVTCQYQTIIFCLSDNGSGFDPQQPTTGIGLISMEQRARTIGATLTISSTPRVGTSVRLEVPSR